MQCDLFSKLTSFPPNSNFKILNLDLGCFEQNLTLILNMNYESWIWILNANLEWTIMPDFEFKLIKQWNRVVNKPLKRFNQPQSIIHGWLSKHNNKSNANIQALWSTRVKNQDFGFHDQIKYHDAVHINQDLKHQEFWFHGHWSIKSEPIIIVVSK